MSGRRGAGEPMQPRSRSLSVSVTKVARQGASAGELLFRLSAGGLPPFCVASPRAAMQAESRSSRSASCKPRRGGVFEGESAVADDARRVGADVGGSRQMQAAHPHVALGGDFERAFDGQEAAGPAPVERWRVERLDAPGGVGVDRLGAASVEEMRQVGGDRDHRLRPAPNQAQGLGDIMRIGVADENGNDLERGRQHRLQHHEMHFERMLARERPRVDEDAASLGELGVSDGCDRRLAERRPPLRRRMDRDARGKRPDAPGRR